jgi:hypothetical protein
MIEPPLLHCVHQFPERPSAAAVGDSMRVSPGQRPVYIVPARGGDFADEHQRCARAVLGKCLAELTGGVFAGEMSGEGDSNVEPYFLPAGTLTVEEARRLGIDSEDDLFGGVVPHPFIASKAIAHPLVSKSAAAPPEWNSEFCRAIAEVVLPGFTIFSRADAEAAGRELLSNGPVQIKATGGFAGFGQTNVSDEAELERELDRLDWDDIASVGLVLEQRLRDVTAFSVGQVRVAGITASYYALQKETANEYRDNIYVGSSLLVVRGDFDALLSLDFSDDDRACIAKACTFDTAVDRHFPGFFASRRNYDVIRGFDGNGDPVSGVLEQSWRVGGASAAEMLALLAFRNDPELTRVQARTVEVFGELAAVPDGALLLYRGVDPRAGAITRYAVAEQP